MAPELNRTGLDWGEDFSIEWHKVPDYERDGSTSWENVCVLRITTADGTRVVRRDKIDGISRLPTGAVHRDAQDKEILVLTTVLFYGGQATALAGTKRGTSDVLHNRIEKAWLGDGFDPFGRGGQG